MNHSFDPQWLPSDSDLINWVERKQAIVSPRYKGEWSLFVFVPPICTDSKRSDIIEEVGPTWRAVVEAAMRRLP